jgi:predicted permease
MPGVQYVGAGGNIPMGGSSGASLNIEHRPMEGARLPEVRYGVASDDYFSALGIPFVRGRAFNSADRESVPPVAIISAGLAKKFWPNGDPIGVRVKIGPDPSTPWATIIGIVGDVFTGASDAPEPMIYMSQRQDHWFGGAVVIRATGDPHSLRSGVREALKRVDPGLPMVGLQSLEEFRSNTRAIADRRMQLQLMLMFAIVALLVSAIGVYGVSAYATEARRREFGIRMALGASRRGVLWLALREGASVAVVGAVIGVPLAWLLATRLRDLLFEVAPFDPLTIGAVVAALLLVVFAASLIPARRATLIDPARTMRTE